MDNQLIYDGQIYSLEKIWRKHKKDYAKDSKGILFPFPVPGDDWPGRMVFSERLKEIQYSLNKKGQFVPYPVKMQCLICDELVTTKIFIYRSIMWEDSLTHYVDDHAIEPSDAFKKNIFLHENKQNMINYVILKKHQILIMDSLMIHGGYRKKYNGKYSEHAGTLFFKGENLSKIIVSADTTRVDATDDQIYMPNEMDEWMKTKYIFHTHPPTPREGGRAATEGIIYEIPSIGDILHFIDHNNNNRMIGSLIICAEGMYCIRKNDSSKQITASDRTITKVWNKIFFKIQKEAIAIYGTSFSKKTFYTKIAPDTRCIDRFNEVFSIYNIWIDYYPRKKDTAGNWYIDTVYLPNT